MPPDEPHTSWHERYRPQLLEEIALDPEVRRRFESYLKSGVITDHLLLFGPAGTGKTTAAQILLKAMDCQVLELNASSDRGIDVIRDKVEMFAKTYPMAGKWKAVFMDEADGLTEEAQDALRGVMQKYSFQTKFIFTTNHFDKIIPPLQSRCEKIEMNAPPVEERARVLSAVLTKEGKPRPVDEVRSFAAQFPDMRELLRQAQNRIGEEGTLEGTVGAVLVPTSIQVWPGITERRDGEQTGGERTDGAKVLDDLVGQFSTYLSLPAGGVEALALWTVWAWASEAFSIAPILTVLSPTMRAGKSTAFEMLEQLLIPGETYHPSSITPAVLFRLKGMAADDQAVPSATPRPPTLCLLMDEADNWLGLRPELQAVLNSGHTRRTAIVLRMVNTTQVGRFSSWYPKALALVNRPSSPLPDTLRDRSIVIPMQRKRKGEDLPKFPKHQVSPALSTLCEQVAYWVRDHFTELREVGGGPLLSSEDLQDRARDNWHQLIAVAKVAGGGWEERARRAALILSDATGDTEVLIDLLTDIKEVFESERVEELRSVILVQKLRALEERGWKELRVNERKLSNMLRPLRIGPTQIWTPVGMKRANKQGYKLAQFQDAFSRYL